MPLPRRYENRYLVLKWDDLQNVLNGQDMDHLGRIMQQVTAFRQAHGHPDRRYVVVSDKRPSLYEEVWGMFLADIAQGDAEQRRRWREELNASIRALSEQSAPQAEEPAARAAPSRAQWYGEPVGEMVADEVASDENFALEASDEVEEAEEIVTPASPSTGQFSARRREGATTMTREELAAILNAATASSVARRARSANPTARREAQDAAVPRSGRNDTNMYSTSTSGFQTWSSSVRNNMTYADMETSMNAAWGTAQ